MGVELAAALIRLSDDGASGRMDVEAEGIGCRVYFKRGKPVYVDKGGLGDTLGRVLVRQGMLTEPQYSAAIERMTESLVNNEEIRLGEVLIEMELLSPNQVGEALQLQFREKLLTCFHWEKVSWSFVEGEDALEGVQAFPGIEVRRVVLEGIKRYVGPLRLDAELSSAMERAPRLVEAPELLRTAFGFNDAETRFLSSIDGTVTVQELLDTAPLDRVHAAQIMVALVSAGSAALGDKRPKIEVPVQKNPAPSAASATQELLAKGAVKMTNVELARIKAKKLSQTQVRLRAETACARGRQYLTEGGGGAALKEFERACRLMKGQEEYSAYRAWARYRTAADSEVKEAAREAKELGKRLSEQEPNVAIGHLIIAHFHEREGQQDRARASYKRVLRLEPDNVDAQRALRLIEKKR